MIFKIFFYKNVIKILTFIFGRIIWREIANANNIKNNEINDKNVHKAISLFNRTFKEDDSDTFIEMKNVSKIYSNGYMAVNNFNLNIKPKEFVCLLGPSGCGKTTLLRMVAGLEGITKGDYMMSDIKMNSFDPSERNTSMVFQNYALYPFMTVYKNVSFGLKLKTYNNVFFNKNLEKFIFQNKPKSKHIIALKNKIAELKNPLKNEIRNKLIELKKAKKRKSNKVIEINQDLLSLKNKNINFISNNKSEILLIKKEIAKLIGESKKELLKNREERKNNRNIFKEEKARMTIESKDYFSKNKIKIPKIKSQINSLKQKKKNIILDFKKYLKDFHKGEVHINDSKKDSFKNNNNKFKKDIEKISIEIQEKMYEITIIKNKNIHSIADKKESLLKDISIKKMIYFSIVWKMTIFFRIINLSKIVGLENFLNRKPVDLSGGQRQRVALMRAISKESKLFLFDEPLSNLDAKLRTDMRQEIRKIHQTSQSTSLYVTHDQIEAMTMADKVVVMNDGFIQQIDTPSNLYDNPSNLFVANFIGNPTMNIIEGTVKNNFIAFNPNDKLTFGAKTKEFLKKYINKKVMIGIRPNNISLSNKKNPNSIAGIVKEIEMTGSDLEIEITINGNLIKVVSNDKNIKINDNVYVNFKAEDVHIFDKETKYCISSINNNETLLSRKIWEDNFEDRAINRKIINSEKNKKNISSKIFNKIKEKIDYNEKLNILLKKIDEDKNIA